MKTLNPLLAGKPTPLVAAHAFSFTVILIGHLIVKDFYYLFSLAVDDDIPWGVRLLAPMLIAGILVFPAAIMYGRSIEGRAPRLAMWMKPITLIALLVPFSAPIRALYNNYDISVDASLALSLLAIWMVLLAYPHALHHLTRPLHRYNSLRSLARREIQPLLWIVLWSVPPFGFTLFGLAIVFNLGIYGSILVLLLLSLVVCLSLYNRVVLPYAPPSVKWERRSRIAREIYLWLLWGMLAASTVVLVGILLSLEMLSALAVVLVGTSPLLLLAWTFVLVRRSRRGFRRALRAAGRRFRAAQPYTGAGRIAPEPHEPKV